ncbi:hypothetical protein AVEN_234224-1 [Araneus ventricosus]|uniref:Uncharacterized protein n=1 Tax=Araneus ventricosus TaxID=182803 RepID=A0A4Y2A914_ARAVE|nr:hypothetical protein AVEN_234224-1 [Araneus ventricosus]
MSRTTPEIASPCKLPPPNFRITLAGKDFWLPTSDLKCNRPTYTTDRQWNLVLEPGTVRSRSQELSIRPRQRFVKPGYGVNGSHVAVFR